METIITFLSRDNIGFEISVIGLLIVILTTVAEIRNTLLRIESKIKKE